MDAEMMLRRIRDSLLTDGTDRQHLNWISRLLTEWFGPEPETNSPPEQENAAV